MRTGIVILLNFIFVFCSYQILFSQKMIVVERPGTIKNIKYEQGNEIFFEDDNGKRFYGRIDRISDSSFYLDNKHEVKYNDISVVLKPRLFLYHGYFKIRLAGFGFLFLNTFNRLSYNEKPVFNKSGLITASALFGLSYLMRMFVFKRYKTGKKWRIKYINL